MLTNDEEFIEIVKMLKIREGETQPQTYTTPKFFGMCETLLIKGCRLLKNGVWFVINLVLAPISSQTDR